MISKVGKPGKKSPKKRVETKQSGKTISKSAKEAIFVEAYIQNGGNATEAAKRAGYSKRTAYSAGGRLLKNVEILTLLTRRNQETLVAAREKTNLTVEGVLRELHGIVHSDLRRCFNGAGALLPPHQWPDDVARSMASVKVVEMAGVPGYVKEVKFWDKNSGIEKAMKTLGMLIDRTEVGKPGDFRSDAELDAAIVERATKLGIVKAQKKAT